MMRRADWQQDNTKFVPYKPKQIKGGPEKRVYINNLSYDCKWQDLKEHMSKAGAVAFVELFEDPRSGKPLGCGLVQYNTEEDAKTARETLNETPLSGRTIKVKEDEERYYPKIADGPTNGHPPVMGPGGPMPMGMPMGPGHPMGPLGHLGPPPGCPMGSQPISNVVFVSNLSYDITPKFLRDTFKVVGEIVKVNLERDKEGKSKGFGTVVFGNPEIAMRAIDAFDNSNIKGRRMSVRLDKLTAVNVSTGPPMCPPMGMPPGMGPQMMPPMGLPPPPGPRMMQPINMGVPPGLLPPGGPHDPHSQSQMLQSIGLAAITNLLQGNNSNGANILSGLLSSGGPLSSILGQQGAENEESRTERRSDSNRSERRRSGSRGEERSRPYERPNREDRENKGEERGYNNNYSRSSKKSKIFVRNIPFTLNQQQLKDFFRHAGPVTGCDILTDKKGDSRGCATVLFDDKEHAERAVNMFHRSHLSGREIEVKFDN